MLVNKILNNLQKYVRPNLYGKQLQNLAQVAASKDVNDANENICEDIIDKVSEVIKNGIGSSLRINPLFAVVHLYGRQYKITNYDLLRVPTFFPAEIGEKIRLEKVLLVGGNDFTLVGRPLLPRDSVTIMATVVERGLSHMYTDYRHWKKPKLKTRMRLYRYNRTVLRINTIHIENTPRQMENNEHQQAPKKLE